MTEQARDSRSKHPGVTIDAVERVLAVGRLLLSVLRPEELDQLLDALAGETTCGTAIPDGVGGK